MRPTIRVANDTVCFIFAEHTAELQSLAGAWFSDRLSELREPLRNLVAQRLFIHHEGASLRTALRIELTLSFQRLLRPPDDGQNHPVSTHAKRFPVRATHAHGPTSHHNTLRKDVATLTPLHPTDAVRLVFRGNHPFAVQVAVGGICAASGRTFVPALSRNPQNYLSTPLQSSLHGFRCDAHTFRPFSDVLSAQTAVQTRVVPLTVDALWEREILPLCMRRWKAITRPCGPGDDVLEDPHSSLAARATASVPEHILLLDERIPQEIVPDPLPRETWDEMGALGCDHRFIAADHWPDFSDTPASSGVRHSSAERD